MKIRNQLLLVMAVPLSLLIVQIMVVNLFTRELQSAVEFIASAHKAIEADFVASEVAESMREDIRQLPAKYMSNSIQGNEHTHLFSDRQAALSDYLREITDSSAMEAISPALVAELRSSFDMLVEEYTQTDLVVKREDVDMDTLLERAIAVDKRIVGFQAVLDSMATELRKQLQLAIDREKEIHNRPVIAGIVIGSGAVLLLLIFTWLYVDKKFVGRIVSLSQSMKAISGGNLQAPVPEAASSDEIGEMASALTVFRDTAVEVEENNLRDIATARQRLVSAIESISEGFSLYDKYDQLVICNQRYRTMIYPGLEDQVVTGAAFGELLEQSAFKGLYADASGREQDWISERMRRHKSPGDSFLIERSDGEWINVTEQKTEEGGTVAIYADITQQKRSELALIEAKQKTEEANQVVSQKNAMLESLSSKLSKYLSPQVYSSIFSGQQDVEITSQRKKLTIMFSDIAGFTETTDKLESEELTNLLNKYLTDMSAVALDYGATIDKYIGDAIMVFFGDPETRGEKQDAIQCVKMAVKMQQQMNSLQRDWEDRGIENPFRLRIGINTGYCTVGNFGSDQRMDYTIIGNEVNLAARLQTAATPGEVVISHETWSLVKEEVDAVEQKPVIVKGFRDPVRNYRIKDLSNVVTSSDFNVGLDESGTRISLDVDSLSENQKKEMIESIKTILNGIQ